MSVTVVNAIAVHVGCLTGVREQQNQRSSFIDGTALYGFNRERELLLRVRSMAASWLIFLQKRAHLPLIKVLHSNVLLAMNIFDISLNMFFFLFRRRSAVRERQNPRPPPSLHVSGGNLHALPLFYSR